MRRTIVRFQILLLVLAVGLIGYRIIDGTPAPAGTLVLHDLEDDRIEARTLRVTGEPQRFAIDAAGSFASPDGRRLEAYAWILDRTTREVVWQMTAQRAQRSRGTVASQRDTITLGPGTYDAFFTAYGSDERPSSSGLFSTSRRWRNNAPHWKLVIQALGDPAFAQSTAYSRHDAGWWKEARPTPPGVVWTSAPEGEDDVTSTLLVRESADVQVYAVGAFQPTEASPVQVVPVGGTSPVWTLPVAESEAAGGSRSNRQYRGTFSLEPGLYEVRYEPGRGWSRWHSNPPLDPAAWGVTFSTEREGAVVQFEPFETAEPTLSIARPGDQVNRSVRFRITRRTPILVYAMGEMTSETSRYDYGWIERANGERLWEMEYDRTERAGGDRKNRVAEEWVVLDPGTYQLRYKSDGSHSYGEFNSSPPDDDERWGISLFAADAGALVGGESGDIEDEGGEEMVSVTGNGSESSGLRVMSVAGKLQAPPPVDGAVVALTRTGSGEDVSAAFEVRDAGEYRLYATGELSGSSVYDYAMLLDSEGRTVWQMSSEGTVAAGGASRNRTFDGTIRLEPGRYTMRYQTDGSHAYDDFSGDDAPTYPNAWGVILRAINR